MKRRCYERGAEDNLTAVIVRVGSFVPTETFDSATERTVSSMREEQMATTIPNLHDTVPADAPVQEAATVEAVTAAPASTVAASVTSPGLPAPPVGENNAHKTNPVLDLESQTKSKKRKGGGARAFLLLLLFAAIAGAAFYGGIYYQRRQAESAALASATPTPAPTPVDTIREFERKRQQVDKDPANMVKTMREEVAAKGVQNPLDSTDPEFLYLYGRGLVLMGDNLNAMTAFDNAIANLKENTSPLQDKLRVEARLAALAVALRLRALRPDAEQKAIRSFDELINKGTTNSLGLSQ
jgi:hypothetical protein